MTPTLLIIVLVVGVLLLALEIVALPGGIAGAFGLLLTGFGVWQSYLIWGPTVGNTILCICAAITVVMLALFLKAKTWKRFSLNEESDSRHGFIGCRCKGYHSGTVGSDRQGSVRWSAGGGARYQQVYRPRPPHRGGGCGGLPHRRVRGGG